MLKDLMPVFLVLGGIIFLMFFVIGVPSRDDAGSLFMPRSGGGSFGNFVPRPTAGTSSGSGSSQIDQYQPEQIKVNNRTYTKSPWYGQVQVGRGNSSRTEQPRQEYITLASSRGNDNPINITGWTLSNADNERLFDIGGGKVEAGKTNRATIGEGVEVLLPEGRRATHWINLKPGDKAIVTSGTLYEKGDIDIETNFRTNMCTGYLQKTGDYSFTPSLALKCPLPKAVENFDTLPDSCYDFIKRMPKCHTPDTDPYRDREGELVRNHVDKNTEVSRFCRNFVVTNFSYGACVATHYNDENFLSPEWRIFLGRRWEMWKDRRDTIYLFDSSGRLVDYESY